MYLLILTIVLQAFIVVVGQTYTRWLPNTNLNNPYNWDTGRLPCGNDRMILPDDGPVVFYQMNTTIQELVLPLKGQLVFGLYATLAFTNQPDHSATCLDSGAETSFNASHPADWLDPKNWCPTDTEQGPCKTVPLLDSERVPCTTDNAVFPRGSSYYVSLGSNMNLAVNTLKVSGKAYSTSTFQSFLSTEKGRDIFPPPQTGSQSQLDIQRRRCTDPTGCPCGNDQGQILSAICKIQSPRCNRPRCRSPVTPAGHCCPICGAQINVTYGTGFNLGSFKSSLQRNFFDQKTQYKVVQKMVSKCSDGTIQVVLTDEKGKQSYMAAKDIVVDILADIRTGGFKYNAMKVTWRSSKAGTNGDGKTSAHSGEMKSRKSGTVAGITIGVILVIVLALAAAAFLYKKKMSSDEPGFNFNVFDKFNRFALGLQRRPDASAEPSVHWSWGGSLDSGVSSLTTSSQGFDNPIYGSVQMETMRSMELSAMHHGLPENQQVDDSGFDNPLYDTDQRLGTITYATEQPDDKGISNPLFEDGNQESLFSDPSVVEEEDSSPVMTIGHQEHTDA